MSWQTFTDCLLVPFPALSLAPLLTHPFVVVLHGTRGGYARLRSLCLPACPGAQLLRWRVGTTVQEPPHECAATGGILLERAIRLDFVSRPVHVLHGEAVELEVQNIAPCTVMFNGAFLAIERL